MEPLICRFPSWFRFVMSTYRERFEEVITALESVAFRSLDERVEFYLRSRSEASGSPVLHITHQEIARDLNSSREVISRLLKRLETLGRVRLAT
jgi:CRP/FNR family transcriptional regulator